MVGCLTKTRKVGGSIVVTLPKELVENQKIKPDEIIEITVRKCKKAGFGSLRNMKSFTVEDELQTHD